MARRKRAVAQGPRSPAPVGVRPRTSGRSGRKAPWFVAAILAAGLVPIVFAWPIRSDGFLLDDYVLYQRSPSLTDLGSIAKGFTLDVGAVRKGSPTAQGSYYRPVFLAFSTLYYQVVGPDPQAWHLASVLLAGLIGSLAMLFLFRSGLAPPVALLASLVFSLHPSHVSSVAWASGLQELLAGCFALLALLAIDRRPDEPGARSPLVLAAVAYVLALLSKEAAIGVALFVPLLALAERTSAPERSRRWFRASVVLGAVTAIYLLIRVLLFGALAVASPGAPPFGAALPAIPVAFLTYARLVLWPVSFGFFQPERATWAFLDPVVISGSLILLLTVGVLVWALRSGRRWAAPLAWWLAFLAPVLNLWALSRDLMITDRYLFLPVLALPWCLGIVLERKVLLVVLAALAVVFGGLSLRYQAIFANERTFISAMEEAAPSSSTVFAEKGRLLLASGEVTSARTALERAVQNDPLAPGAHTMLGDLDMQRADLSAAEAHYRQALVVRPEQSKPFKLLTLAISRSGNRARALALAEETARRWPQDEQAQLIDAVLLLRAGDRPRAAAAFAVAQRIHPDDPDLAGGLDAAAARLESALGPR